ncbi:HNH endonuclease [Kribbella antibiotica]|uniref:HNH endonuclease n=2 Tax=Kribbella antibiotica TaxID=190195 RepID=A0A4R4YVL5_9ACTN|nr:HNH endonuclease [Kribbella antibiotica]
MAMLLGMEMLTMPPVWSLSVAELVTSLDTAHAVRAALDTFILQAGGRLDEMGAAQELGARDTVDFLSERYREAPAEVRKALAFMAALRKYPLVAEALPDPTDPARPWTMRPAQGMVIVETLEKVPSTVSVETLEFTENQMVGVAKDQDPRRLTKFGNDVLARLDTDGAEPSEEEAHAKRSLRLRQVDGGVKFSGFLPGADGEQLTTQIHMLSKPHKTVDGERDPRPQDVRQADALVATMDAAAGNPDHPGVPHLTVTIDFDDLKAAVGETAGAVGELVFGNNLSASAVRLLACDAAILPIVLGGDSQPLDVGTEQRFVNRYMRRALIKRDKGCVVCKAPPWMCHAHHIIHWANGGPTSMQNLVLLCASHHRAVHAGQWAVAITGGIVNVTRPSWADPSPVTDPAVLAAAISWANAGSTKADGGNVKAGRASAVSDPMYGQPNTLPATSKLPSPTLAAKREAFRAHLTAMVPNYTDPWSTNANPTAGP